MNGWNKNYDSPRLCFQTLQLRRHYQYKYLCYCWAYFALASRLLRLIMKSTWISKISIKKILVRTAYILALAGFKKLFLVHFSIKTKTIFENRRIFSWKEKKVRREYFFTSSFFLATRIARQNVVWNECKKREWKLSSTTLNIWRETGNSLMRELNRYFWVLTQNLRNKIQAFDV